MHNINLSGLGFLGLDYGICVELGVRELYCVSKNEPHLEMII